MAKERIQVGGLPAPPRITPRAQPVDTFHRPDEELIARGPTQEAQLAEALGQFQPTLQSIAVNAKNRDNVVQRSAGEQAILADKRLQTRQALGEAVRSGKLPAAQNPAFLEGMRRQVYRIEGEQYDQALRRAYAESNSRNENDITDFVSGFTSKYIEGLGGDPSDPELAREFTPRLEASQANLFARHRSERDQAIEHEAEENTGTEIGLLLDRMSQDPAYILGAKGTQEKYSQLIHGVVQTHYENGLSGTRSNEIVARAIAQKAEEAGDPSYLDMLDQIPGGSGPIGQTQFAKNLKYDTANRINSAYLSSHSHQNELIKAEKDKAKEDFQGQFIIASNTDPDFNLKDWVLKSATIDPSLAASITAYDSARRSASVAVTENPPEVAGLWSRVYDVAHPLTHTDVVQAATDGKINGATARELSQEIGKRGTYSILDDDAFKLFSGKVSASIGGGEYVRTPEQARQANEGQLIFNRQMSEFMSKNPNATFEEKMAKGEALMNTIVPRFVSSKATVSDPTAELDSTDELRKVVSVPEALAAPVNAFDWQTDQFYTDLPSFDQAIKKYNASQGKDGSLVRLAEKYGVDPQTIITKQRALLRNQPKATPKK
jgi:hypothetical protein